MRGEFGVIWWLKWRKIGEGFLCGRVLGGEERGGKGIGKVWGGVLGVDWGGRRDREIIVLGREGGGLVMEVKEDKEREMGGIELDVGGFDGGRVRGEEDRGLFEMFGVWVVWDRLLEEEVGLGV